MENEFSNAAIVPPAVPADFEARAGATKTDLVRAIFQLLRSSQVSGFSPTTDDIFDIGEIVNRLTKLEATVTANKYEDRTVSIAGVANGLLTVSFDDIGTNNYSVFVTLLTANPMANTVTWSLISGSKATNGCQLYIKGDASTYTVEVHIVKNIN